MQPSRPRTSPARQCFESKNGRHTYKWVSRGGTWTEKDRQDKNVKYQWRLKVCSNGRCGHVKEVKKVGPL